jgi:hypothetical protein
VLALSTFASMVAWAHVGNVSYGAGFGIVWSTFVLIILNVVGTHVFGMFGTGGGSSDSALSVGWWLGAMMAGSFMFFLLGIMYASTGAAIGSSTGQGIGALYIILSLVLIPFTGFAVMHRSALIDETKGYGPAKATTSTMPN